MNIPTAQGIENMPIHSRTIYKMGHRDARHAAAELALSTTPPALPPGWQAVPVEPTAEILIAIASALPRYLIPEALVRIYKAGLAAAPPLAAAPKEAT